LAGKLEINGENLPQCHFAHHKSTWPDPGSNPGRHGGKPATNHLSYGTACLERCCYARLLAENEGKYCDMSGRPNLMQKIPIARQRIRITYPRIQLTSPSQQWGYCYNLVTGCKHAGIVATNRPTIDNSGSPRLYKELMIDYQSSLVMGVC
jgi:hypothetical protein